MTASPARVRSVSSAGAGAGAVVGGRADARERDLVVGDERGDGLLALGGLLVARLAHRPLLRVDDRSTPAVAHLELEVLQGLVLEHRPEAHLREGDAAVGRADRERGRPAGCGRRS